MTLTPTDVVLIYSIVAPLAMLFVLLFYIKEMLQPQVNVNFPSVIACGKVDQTGSKINWSVPLCNLKPNQRILIVGT